MNHRSTLQLVSDLQKHGRLIEYENPVDPNLEIAEIQRRVYASRGPAIDINGVEIFLENKHWGCRGPLVIDARIKPHHAPPLMEAPEITQKVDSIAASTHPISKFL
ncbi:MAG: hypothetical protein VX438_09010 [Planctomycetota bacterium]|nr:hypothetical protein [Planctomycetota bacterium]